MDTSVQIVLKSATEPVEAAIKKVVYVITDANPDGEEYIVKMNAVEGILAKTVTVVVDIVSMKLPVTISMERVMKTVTLGIKHRTVQMNASQAHMD